MKNKDATEVGIRSLQITLPKETSEDELLGVVAGLNADPETHGVLVQLPLPDQIDEAEYLPLNRRGQLPPGIALIQLPGTGPVG